MHGGMAYIRAPCGGVAYIRAPCGGVAHIRAVRVWDPF